jgi:hypothetical protein
MPRKIKDLLNDYRTIGATIDLAAGKGSHRKITHPSISRPIILSGKDNEDAKHYQEKDLKQFRNNIS